MAAAGRRTHPQLPPSQQQQQQQQGHRRKMLLQGSSKLVLATVLLAMCSGAARGTDWRDVDNNNHNIIFLLANQTPTYDFKGALMSCGMEAASRVAASTGTTVKVLATFHEQWAAKDKENLKRLPIEYVKLDPSALVADTPLEEWYRSGQWLKHPSPYQDLSNAARVAAVYKLGGMYLDSDIIMMGEQMAHRPMFVAKQDEEVVNNHLFRFPAGHPFLWAWMQRWMEICTADHPYAKCGPGVLHPLFHERCVESRWPNLCVDVIPHNLTTPFAWDQVTGLVAPNTDEVYAAGDGQMYGVHWFNTPLIKWSKQTCTIETSYLHAVFLKHCPLTLFHNYDTMICEQYRVTPAPRSVEDVYVYVRPATERS